MKNPERVTVAFDEESYKSLTGLDREIKIAERSYTEGS